MSRHVLCVKAIEVGPLLLQNMQLKTHPVGSFECDVFGLRTWLVPKEEAEVNEEFLQLIPYIICMPSATPKPKMLAYRRGSSGEEKRLLGARSIGVGGHVERCDMSTRGDTYSALQRCIRREFDEEVGTTPDEPMVALTHFIADRTNSVGRVHLGITGIAHVPADCLRFESNVLIEAGFFTPETLKADIDSFEGFSRAILHDL